MLPKCPILLLPHLNKPVSGHASDGSLTPRVSVGSGSDGVFLRVVNLLQELCGAVLVIGKDVIRHHSPGRLT